MHLYTKIIFDVFKVIKKQNLEWEQCPDIEYFSKRLQVKSILFANIIGGLLYLSLMPFIFHNLSHFNHLFISFEMVMLYFAFAFIVSIFFTIKFNYYLVHNYFHLDLRFEFYTWLSLINLIVVNYLLAYILNHENFNFYIIVFSIAYINVCMVLSIKARFIYNFINLFVLFSLYIYFKSDFKNVDYFQLTLLVQLHGFFFLIGQVFNNIWLSTVHKHIVQKNSLTKINQQKNLIEQIFKEQQTSLFKLYSSLNIDVQSEELQSNPLLISSKINNLIVELNTMKDQLKDSKEKYKDIFENVSDGILIRNKKWEIVIANRKTNEITGFNLMKKEIKDLKVLISPDYKEKYNQYLLELQELKDAYFEGEITTNRGKNPVYIEIYSTPIIKNNRFYGSRDILRNISEKQKQLTESYKKMETERLFILNLNHELRTPLNSIVGLIQLLQESELDESQKEMMGIVQHSSIYLKNLISDILDLTKIESGAIDINLETVDFRKINHQILQNFRLQAQERNLKLDFIYPEEFPTSLQIDPVLYTKVVNNLVSNALKFTQKGSILLEIRNGIINRNQQKFVQIRVRDTGIGITQEHHASVFEKFKQLESKNISEISGMGLGLSICKEILLYLNGDISIESDYVDGASFVFQFPIKLMPINKILKENERV